MHEVSVCDLLPAQFNVSLDHVDTFTDITVITVIFKPEF